MVLHEKQVRVKQGAPSEREKMSDYSPTRTALMDAFPGFADRAVTASPTEETPVLWTAIYLMDQAVQKGDDVEAAREGFNAAFDEAVTRGKAWAVEARATCGGSPWDEAAYRAALRSNVEQADGRLG
jgi:hypothetical protein